MKIPPGLSPEERKLYLSYLAVGGGSNGISKKELYHGLSMAGLELAQKKLLAVWKEVDVDDSGYLDFGEFVVLAKKFQQATHAPTRFLAGLLTHSLTPTCLLTCSALILQVMDMSQEEVDDDHFSAAAEQEDAKHRFHKQNAPMRQARRLTRGITRGVSRGKDLSVPQIGISLDADALHFECEEGASHEQRVTLRNTGLLQQVGRVVPPWELHSSPPLPPGAGAAGSGWRAALWRRGTVPLRAY